MATHHAVIVDDDWNAMAVLSLVPDEFAGVSEQVTEDFVKRLGLLMPALSPVPSAAGEQLRFQDEDFRPLNDLGFVTRTEEGDHVRVEIDLPALITAQDWSGEPTGPSLTLELYLPGRVIDANTLDWEDGYEMLIGLPGTKRARVVWELTERHLSRPLRLWVVVDPGN